MPSALDFGGTGRFEIVRLLGEGGMGVVYEALDRRQGTRVALKTLRSFSPAALLRFKQEFRALADIQHRNLVSLHELFEDVGHWFFTMELVDGSDFLSFVRGVDGPPSGLADTLPPGARDEHRLRKALTALACGVQALHERGKVHRDIKPSNVLVTPEGRVVLLDFGLVTEAMGWEGDTGQSAAGLVGTIAYMAPEQAASEPVGPAADWYAVGVVLYEALTGRVPFLGPPLEVLSNKQRFEPAAPRAIDPSVPEDLDALCRDLLRFDPKLRPTGARVLERLGIQVEASAERSTSLTQTPPFVGRANELEALGQAFADSRSAPVILLVEGESGIGKSALVRRFCEDLPAQRGGTVVLAGRCYEREAVPFKAVDGIIDALSRHLARLPEAEAAALLPRHAALLAQIFPVLRRASAFAQVPAGIPVADTQEQRTRVFGALRELFARISDRRTLLLWIDDLQWADADSITLLNTVLQPPEAPPLLLLATRRAAGTLPPLRGDVRRLEVPSLPLGDAAELARRLLARAPAAKRDAAATIAAEAKGHPLFVDELVRHAIETGATEGVRLDGALAARVARLDARERELLEVLAVAGAPLVIAAAAHAAGIEPSSFFRSASLLRVANLVRTTGSGTSDLVECYHDRVRDAVVQGLDEERVRKGHRRLAVALEAQGGADAEALARHWEGAGDRARAAEYAASAATAAGAQLAFDRAAELYRRAIALGHRESAALEPKLAEALGQAGRGKESAETYLRAAARTPAAEALDYRRRAAEQYLRSGHIDSGLEVIETVLTAVGMTLPRTPRGALLGLLVERARVRLRGYLFSPRDEAQVPPQELVRIDTCYSVASGLGMVDNFRAAAFQARGLRLALAAGEPRRVIRGLALEAVFLSVEKRGSRRAAALRDVAGDEARRLGDPYLLAWHSAAVGFDQYQEGAFRVALEHTERALEIFRHSGGGVTYELDYGGTWVGWALYYLGRWAELGRRIPHLLAEAQNRGNLYTATTLTTGFFGAVWLALDDIATAKDHVARAETVWARQPGWWHLQHYWMWIASSQLELYEGEPSLARAEVFWPGLERSLLLRIAMLRAEAFHLRARVALAEARLAPQRAPALLRAARSDARRIARDKARCAAPLAALALAGADAADGAAEPALAHLERAIAGFDATDMALFAAVARRRKGELLGGDEGRALVAAANAFMLAERIRRPDRIVAMLAPGFSG